MERIIDVAEAEIKTAGVEIKTLTVRGKQLTLSVFRQIPQGWLIDSQTLRLCGIPWGIVNYYWGDMDKSKLHVVWQYGNELRRDLIGEHDYYNRRIDRSLWDAWQDEYYALARLDQLYIAV